MHDFTEDAILKSPVQRFEAASRPDTVQTTSLATIAAEAPYQKPDSLDFSRIATLIAAKHDSAADHLWSLREDPSYFEAQMLEYKEHRRELLLDCHGRQHSICSPGHEDQFWARIVHHEVTRAYFQVEIFSDLQSQAEELKGMKDLYADELSTPSELPEPYAAALSRFTYSLCYAVSAYTTDLGLGVSASPPLRRYHERCPEMDPTTHVEGIMKKRNFYDDPMRVRFDWLVVMLWNRDDLYRMIGLTIIIDELQRLIDTDSARSLLSAYIASTVGDLSIVSECIHQLELYQPWMDKRGLSNKEEQEDLAEEMKARAQPWLDIIRAVDPRDSELGNLGRPIDGKFAFPIAKRRTHDNVDQMRRAEQNLDKFWHKVDRDIESKCGKLGDGAVHRLLTRDRTLQRTPEWIQPVCESTESAAEELYIPFSQLFFDDQTHSKHTLLGNPAQPTKEKIKTRKPGNPEASATQAEAVAPHTEYHSEPLFALNASALKRFKTLFFTQSATSTPGEVVWMDFVYAMMSVCMGPSGSSAQILPGWQSRAVSNSMNRMVRTSRSHTGSLDAMDVD